MIQIRFVVKRQVRAGRVFVTFSDGSIKIYDAFKLGCEWFKMSNDAFFQTYGFNFTPHEIPGLYQKCRKAVYPDG